MIHLQRFLLASSLIIFIVVFIVLLPTLSMVLCAAAEVSIATTQQQNASSLSQHSQIVRWCRTDGPEFGTCLKDEVCQENVCQIQQHQQQQLATLKSLLLKFELFDDHLGRGTRRGLVICAAVFMASAAVWWTVNGRIMANLVTYDEVRIVDHFR